MTPAEVIAPLPLLRGLALRLAGRDGANDLLQDVAEQAIMYCNRIDPATHRGWLAQVMRHRAARTEPARRAWIMTDTLPERPVDSDPYWRVRLGEVDAFLNRVAARDRAALLATAVGISGSPLRHQRAHVIRRRLRAALGEGA